MKYSRKKKALYNILSSSSQEVIVLVCGLIIPKLILENYGSAYNGITASATQFLSLISLLTLGVAGSTRAALYDPLAKNDNLRISSILKATELYYRKIGYILCGYTLLLAILYPFVVSTGYGFWDVSLLILAVGIHSFGNYYFGVTNQLLLTADQKIFIVNIVTTFTIILNAIVSVILIKSHVSIQLVKLSSSFVFLLKPIFFKLYVTFRYKINSHCEPAYESLRNRKHVLVHSIANIVHDNTDIVVLTLFCDIKVVSVYTVYNYVMSTLKKTQTIFTNGTEAILGNMWANNETERIKQCLGYYELFIAALVAIVFSTGLIMILPFITLYTHGVNDINYILPLYAVIITITQAVYCFRSPYTSLIQGAGHYKETKKYACIEAASNLLLSLIFVRYWGIIGVAIGTLAANILRTGLYAFYVEKHLSPRGCMCFIKKMVLSAVLVLICSLAGKRILTYFNCNSWIHFFTTSLVVFTANCIITITILLTMYFSDIKSIILMFFPNSSIFFKKTKEANT